MASHPPRIFISHVHEDADTARLLCDWLETNLLGGIHCFVSTHDGIPLGDRWMETIGAALEESAAMIVLISPRSASRRWIYFEAGAGFIRRIPVVPICINGALRSDLEPPLNVLQAIELPAAKAERELLALVAKKAGLRVPSAPTPLGLRKSKRPVAQSPSSAVSRTFKSSDDGAFAESFRQLASGARRITLVGTGLNVLYNRLGLDLLKDTPGCHWEIFVANPYSPDVELRLIEEESGQPKPFVGRPGLIRRLETLLALKSQRSDGAPLDIALFSHYPTLSFFIIDRQHYFFYPYGFATVGNFSPIFYASASNLADEPLVSFLNSQYELTKRRSVDAAFLHDFRGRRGSASIHRQTSHTALTPLAVYIIPDEGSDLYDFGSQVIGFDIRRQAELPSLWPRESIAAAAEFGFHITVADALYFDQSLVDIARTAVKSLADDFGSFEISLTVQSHFPTTDSISLACQDDSGTLESLHHELIFRFYKRAVASNYTPALSSAGVIGTRSYGTDARRRHLMTDRYNAPYIMNEFKPHLSLLAQVAPHQMAAAETALRDQLPATRFVAKAIVLLTKPAGSSNWQILNEWPFQK